MVLTECSAFKDNNEINLNQLSRFYTRNINNSINESNYIFCVIEYFNFLESLSLIL